jgi:hypothetical protein
MIFSLVLSAILSFLGFIDGPVIAELVTVIVQTCLSAGQELFTGSRVVGLTTLFAILSRSLHVCGFAVLPPEFIGFALHRSWENDGFVSAHDLQKPKSGVQLDVPEGLHGLVQAREQVQQMEQKTGNDFGCPVD